MGSASSPGRPGRPRAGLGRAVGEDTRAMDLSVLFLGTSGSMPTVQRAPASLLIRRGGDRLLIDCGEGTQRQLLRSVGLPDIEHVFLTHFHADHFLGLPGMMKTFALRGREVPLTDLRAARAARPDVRPAPDLRQAHLRGAARRAGRRTRRSSSTATGSAPTRSATAPRRSATRWSRTTGRGASTRRAPRSSASSRDPQFGLLQQGRAGRGRRARRPAGRRHGRVRGRAARSSSPATPSRARRQSRSHTGAELLVHDGTFAEEEVDRARQTGHSTARQAAEVARAADVVAARPHAPLVAVLRARDREGGARVFERTVVPRDFDVIEVPYRERGEPRSR